MESIIRRRMQNTGESYEEAKARVEQVSELMASDHKPASEWLEEWLAAPANEMATEEYLARFVRVDAPPEALALITRFPPRCVVRLKEGYSYRVPAPGELAVSFGVSKQRNRDKTLAWFVIVRDNPGSSFETFVEADAIEVAHYWDGWTPERVEAFFATRKLS